MPQLTNSLTQFSCNERFDEEIFILRSGYKIEEDKGESFMSCQTRLYKRLKRSTEDATSKAIKTLNSRIAFTEACLERGIKTVNGKTVRVKGEEIEETKKLLAKYKRWLRRIEGRRDIFKQAAMLFQPDQAELRYIRKNKAWYINAIIEDRKLVTPFRIVESHVMLFSLKETYRYLNKKILDPNLRIFDHTYEVLEDFWLKYPDGMIEIR